MRRSFSRGRSLVLLLPLIAACSSSEEGTPSVEDTGSSVADTSVAPDTNPPVDTGADPDTGTAMDTASAPDTAMADSTVVDSAVDTLVADTTKPDTTVADTAVADTAVADTTVADTTVADTAPVDTGTLDTGTPDTGTMETSPVDTGSSSCTDKIKNGSETDVDCGGGICPPCSVSKACAIPTDCKSLFCSAFDKTCTGTCTDGEQGPGESDVDCGALCGACAHGKKCGTSADCASGVPCVSGLCGTPVSCKEQLARFPTSASGIYTIDPDGAGGVAPYSVYCDMLNGGGGWTLFFRHAATSALMTEGAVTDSSNTYLASSKVATLAAAATQVHVRTAGAYATRSITSVAGAQPILNLRNLYLLNADTSSINDTDPPSAYWTGPMATTGYSLWYSCGVSPYGGKGAYPAIYWACNNGEGMHVGYDFASWVSYGSSEAIEVYVR
jgi:hypothetical protein